LEYFPINGNGIRGYFSSIRKLRKLIKGNNFDIIHAHYSLSAIVAALARAKPLIVSLMGSDVKAKSWFKIIIWMFYKLFWKITIVKSEDMLKSLGFSKVEIIPNGVDIEKFKPLDKNQCQKLLGWSENKIHILFAANPNRHEKNFSLAKEAVNQLNNPNVELNFLQDVNNSEIPTYLNAANVILLTSLWEGSPNVIKEAMSCCRPTVSTNVGDVNLLFNNYEGYYLCDFEPLMISNKILEAIEYSIKNVNTHGRKRIIQLKLDSTSIAKKLISIYMLNVKK
jgi:glycosyltransferase involved in cell wall biosynthesis